MNYFNHIRNDNPFGRAIIRQVIHTVDFCLDDPFLTIIERQIRRYGVRGRWSSSAWVVAFAATSSSANCLKPGRILIGRLVRGAQDTSEDWREPDPEERKEDRQVSCHYGDKGFASAPASGELGSMNGILHAEVRL